MLVGLLVHGFEASSGRESGGGWASGAVMAPVPADVAPVALHVRSDLFGELRSLSGSPSTRLAGLALAAASGLLTAARLRWRLSGADRRSAPSLARSPLPALRAPPAVALV
jgi:hypothetical protein